MSRAPTLPDSQWREEDGQDAEEDVAATHIESFVLITLKRVGAGKYSG